MVYIDDHNRSKAAPDGYGKQTISKEKFEEIVKEEKGFMTRGQIKKMYIVKDK